MTSLFDPVRAGDFELNNRVVLAPMTRGRAGDERIPNEVMAQYYFQQRVKIEERTLPGVTSNGVCL